MNPNRKDEQKVIKKFAKAMQDKLDVRDYKGRMGWRGKDLWELFALLRGEVVELQNAILFEKVSDIKKETADVGNVAMMIFDVVSRKKA